MNELETYAQCYGPLTRNVEFYMRKLRIEMGAWRLHPTKRKTKELGKVIDNIAGAKK